MYFDGGSTAVLFPFHWIDTQSDAISVMPLCQKNSVSPLAFGAEFSNKREVSRRRFLA